MASLDRYATGYPQIVVCAWCHVTVSPPLDDAGDIIHAEISHTICPLCLTRYFDLPYAGLPLNQTEPRFDS